jgi:hypothetical protein
MKKIDNKYSTDGIKIFKTTDPARCIPSDEPLILFRGQDRLTPALLRYYRQLCADAGSPQEQIDLIDKTMLEFSRWQESHQTKTPD